MGGGKKAGGAAAPWQGWGKGEGREKGKGGGIGGWGGQKLGRRLPTPPELETLPLFACCQRSPGLYTAAPASRGARRPLQPLRGTTRGCPAWPGSPGSASPARGGDAFEERRCPLPWRSDAPATLGAGWCGRGGRLWINPRPRYPAGARSCHGPFLRDATATSLAGRGRSILPAMAAQPRGLGAELLSSTSLAGGELCSSKAEPSVPLERGMCEFGDLGSPSARAYVINTSSTPEHPIWKSAFLEGSHGPAPVEAMLLPGRCRAEEGEQRSVKPRPTREITKGKAVRVRGVLGQLPSPASAPDGASPAGYLFPRWPTRSLARPQAASGTGNLLRPRGLLSAALLPSPPARLSIPRRLSGRTWWAAVTHLASGCSRSGRISL